MDSREKKIYRVTLAGTAVNAALIILKFLAGVFGRSSALIADAVHSLSDFVTDLIVLVFVRIAGRPRDKGHDYGHGKFETMATLIIGIILAGAGFALMYNGVASTLRCLQGERLASPTWFAFAIAVASIVSKEWLYRYTVKVGRDCNSPAVMANAWHHRSDVISSIGTLVGVAGAMFLGENWRVLDPLAAVVVSVFIVKSGYDIMPPCFSELLEASLPEDQEREISELVMSVSGICYIHNLRTRRIGSGVAIDLHAKMDGDQSLRDAHLKASEAERVLRVRFGQNSIINIHMEPVE